MSGRKIGAGLCALGILAFIGALHVDREAAVEDGAFMGQVGLLCLATILLGGGIAIAIFGD